MITFTRIHKQMTARLRRPDIKPLQAFLAMSTKTVAHALTNQIDPNLIDSRNAPEDFNSEVSVVYRDFLTDAEGELLTSDILRRLKRRRYEKGHWDAVITNYKEIELPNEVIDDSRILDVFERVRNVLEESHLTYHPVHWLPAHAIDLRADGELNAHVDSVKFSGDLVAGISLLSSSIMRLKPDDDPDDGGHIDLHLPPLSLYALTGVGRYRYSHELLPNESVFLGPDGSKTTVARDHRLSIILRDSKAEP